MSGKNIASRPTNMVEYQACVKSHGKIRSKIFPVEQALLTTSDRHSDQWLQKRDKGFGHAHEAEIRGMSSVHRAFLIRAFAKI